MSSGEDADILRRPEARPVYLAVKEQAWVAPFLGSSDSILRRLGARLLIDEIVCTVDPASAAAHVENVRTRRRHRGRAVGFRPHKVKCRYCSRLIQVLHSGRLRAHSMHAHYGKKDQRPRVTCEGSNE